MSRRAAADRAPIRRQSPAQKWRQNAWTIQRKAEQHGGSEGDGGGPLLSKQETDQQRHRKYCEPQARPSSGLSDVLGIAVQEPVDQFDRRDDSRKAEACGRKQKKRDRKSVV